MLCRAIDENGVLLRVNQVGCTLLDSQKSGNRRGQRISGVVWGGDGKKVNRYQTKTAGEEPLIIFEREDTRHDGTTFVLEIHPKLIRNASGEPVGIHSSC